MKTLMAIDAGTGSVRAVLFDLEGHQLCFKGMVSQRGQIPRQYEL